MKKFIGIIIVLTFMAIAIIVAMKFLHPHAKPESPSSTSLSLDSLIQVGTPQQRDFTKTCRWFGKVESREKVDVVVLKTSWIDSVNVSDEMFVKKGTPLFTLNDPMIDSRLVAIKKKIVFLQEQVTFYEHKITTEKDSVSQAIPSKKELVVVEDSLVSLRTELKSAKEEKHFLQDAIYIRATTDGVFTNRKVSEGQIVEKGDKLAEIISIKRLRVVATLFPPKNIKLKKKRVIIYLTNGESISGTVVKELPQRTAEGAIVVWIEGPEVNNRLRPGQTVNGKLILSLHKKMLTVPQSAIVKDEQERTYVFLKELGGFHKQPVKTGIVSDGWVESLSGVMEKDTVVIRGAYELFYQDFNKIYKAAD